MAYWLDDGFDTWPEVAEAGTSAAGLYTRCGSWIARNIANGRIADAVVPGAVARMYGSAEWVQRLVDVGLWAAEGGGWRDLRYFDLNPTPERVRQNRERKAAAGRKGGLASGKTRRANQTRSKDEAGASRLVEAPSLPPPSTKEGRGARPASPGATRAPSDNPDWRTMPAYGAPRDPNQTERTRARAAAARAAIPTRARNQPTGPTALEQLAALADQIAPQDTEP